MRTSEADKNRTFSWQQWLAEGLEQLASSTEGPSLPPQFWFHLGQALCEAGTALRILSVYLQETFPDDLLETYGNLLKETTRLGEWPEPPSES